MDDNEARKEWVQRNSRFLELSPPNLKHCPKDQIRSLKPRLWREAADSSGRDLGRWPSFVLKSRFGPKVWAFWADVVQAPAPTAWLCVVNKLLHLSKPLPVIICFPGVSQS